MLGGGVPADVDVAVFSFAVLRRFGLSTAARPLSFSGRRGLSEGVGVESKRSVVVPLWLLGVALLTLGILIGAVVTSILTRSPERNSELGTAASPPPNSAPLSSQVSAPQTSEQVPTPPTPAAPRGSLAVVQAGSSYGQGSASGQCANWLLRFQNNSNTEIVQITFAPPSGEYTDFRGWNGSSFPTVPAVAPTAAVLNVSIPAYGYQDLRFQTCTSTPAPSDPNYEFGVTKPTSVGFTWVTGQTGTTTW